ncbi:Chaperone protein dnaJ 20 [Forsythia ovata]|uniref:Chaperone protein dnaJ 20 n=1 Tax=Forsythia ovata TaxID=205694 RepID=A0ABD1USK0_9LAMI
MEISMQMNNKVFKLKPISCQAAVLAAMHTGKPNFYQSLSLSSQNAGFDEIKKSYKIMALQYHPDVCTFLTKEESTRRFIELRTAYETLSDPNSREIYDYELGFEDLFERRRGCNYRRVWEKQIIGLKKRSAERMENRKCRSG